MTKILRKAIMFRSKLKNKNKKTDQLNTGITTKTKESFV